jgi:hypothetical protein
MGNEVEEIMDSLYSNKWKQDIYLVKWNKYLAETDWTEEPFENFDNKRLFMEYDTQNSQGAKGNRTKWFR